MVTKEAALKKGSLLVILSVIFCGVCDGGGRRRQSR